MRNVNYSITGLFLLSLLLFGTSFANESVIPNPSYGLQPYWGTPSGATESDMVQPLEQGDMYHQEYGLQPHWGTTSGSTESDMVQPLKQGDMYRPDYGLQPYWETR